MTLTPLEQRRACPGERVSFLCTGSEPVLSLYAPPLLVRTRRALFSSTTTVGNGIVVDAITVTQLSASPLIGQLTVDTSQASLVNFEIICENSLLDGTNAITANASFNEAGKLDLYFLLN